MNDQILSDFLDDELPPDRVGELIDALRREAPDSADRRDRLTTFQLIKDAVSGVEAPDDGYTLRILARIEARRNSTR